MKKIFSAIYKDNLWEDQESVSGRGSTLARTENIRSALPRLLESIGATSLFDAACGDFNWMQHVDLSGIKYIGADVVPALIQENQRRFANDNRSFVVLDITRDQLPHVDVILSRDCLIHFSLADALAAVENFKRSDATFLLATTHASIRENVDQHTGQWRSINLRLKPFNFPEPLKLVIEDPESGKGLGVWRIAEL